MGGKLCIITLVIIILALVCLELFMPIPAIECNFANTVNITDGHRFKNGSYKFDNIIYDEGFYKSYDFIIQKNHEKETVETHIRGCLCAIKSCIRRCKDYENHDHIKVYNEQDVEQTIALGNNTDNHIMTHSPCDTMYALDDADDKWIFYKATTLT